MNLTAIARDLHLRMDLKAVQHFSRAGADAANAIPLYAVADIRELSGCEKPTEAFAYHEISSVGDFGFGEPYWIDEANVEAGSEEHRILAKVNKGDIALPGPGSVLIPKVRPNLGKFVLVSKENTTYYTRAFLEARPRGISPELLYCVLRHPATLVQVSRIARIGKGYPTVSAFDLSRFVRVPSALLQAQPAFQEAITKDLDALFGSLVRLRVERRIIDAVLREQLGYNLPAQEVPDRTPFSRSPSQMAGSFDVRMSSHFVNAASLSLTSSVKRGDTTKIIRVCSLPICLGTSPQFYMEESDRYYLGPQAMTAERLDAERLMMISDDFYEAAAARFGLAYGDVLLRRSGASLGKVLYFDSALACIFSDFTMRLRFADPMMARFASYWMRSSLFQQLLRVHAVIGKGPRNIYPYQVGLLPIPSPERHNLATVTGTIDEEVSENTRLRKELEARVLALRDRLSEEFDFASLP